MAPPDFLILGAQKGGTTALYQYLAHHRAVQSPAMKELHFFDIHFENGRNWYESQLGPEGSGDRLRGECSPYYLFHPLVPARVAEYYPDVRMIVVLRDPIERAFSHYRMMAARGVEELSFSEALSAESRRLEGEEDRMLGEPSYRSHAHQCLSYRSRGFYAKQLQRWFEAMAPERLLVLFSEDLKTEPDRSMRTVTDFLEIDPLPPGMSVEPIFVGPPGHLSDVDAETLATAYKHANLDLARLLASSEVTLGPFDHADWIRATLAQAIERSRRQEWPREIPP